MSPLTKLFVVLHVVLSLLLTAGLLVFVNRTDNFQTQMTASKNELAIATARADSAENDARNSREAADKAVAQATSQIGDLQKQVTDANTAVADRDSRLAAGASAAASASADTARLTDALKASEDQKAKLSDIVTASRGDNDSLVKKNSDLNLAVTDLTSKLDVTDRDAPTSANSWPKQKARTTTTSSSCTMPGVATNLTGGLRANGGAVPINGVVRNTKTINGIPYATISVGSADSVQKGMEFWVIDRQSPNGFLGKVTIESVEPNEATGKLDGPNVNGVRAGTEVKTQL